MNDPAFDTPELDPNTQIILLAATNHDLATLKPLLRIPGNASVQDPETGTTPLHAAIEACGPFKPQPEGGENGTKKVEEETAAEEEEYGSLTKAAEVIRELFLSGAIWNDLDNNNETPGCLAHRLGHMELYKFCVEAGVRAELLLALMGGYEELSSGDESEVDEELTMQEAPPSTETGNQSADTQEKPPKKDVNSKDYLASELKFEDNKLLDEDNNGVMMSWETPIMQRTVDLLLPSPSPSLNQPSPAQGKRILNIGFGMGIIDRMFRSTSPSIHHIIEAHPSVLSSLAPPSHEFHSYLPSSPPSSKPENLAILPGRWQDVAQTLLEQGMVYDAIYFDTFAEPYSQLKYFVDEYLPGLLDAEGRFGFFNGLGADRRVCYDVYCKVVECHAEEAGLECVWEDVDVPLSEEEVGDGKGRKRMDREGEGEWEGVRRRYWVLEKYRLPIFRFLG